jgi:hypothetical protein
VFYKQAAEAFFDTSDEEHEKVVDRILHYLRGNTNESCGG